MFFLTENEKEERSNVFYQSDNIGSYKMYCIVLVHQSSGLSVMLIQPFISFLLSMMMIVSISCWRCWAEADDRWCITINYEFLWIIRIIMQFKLFSPWQLQYLCVASLEKLHLFTANQLAPPYWWYEETQRPLVTLCNIKRNSGSISEHMSLIAGY